MNIIQIIIIVFILTMVYGLFQKLQKRELSVPLFLLWLVFWMSIGVVVIFPVLLNRFADLVGVGRGVDVAIYSSVLILFYAMFRVLIRLEQIEKSLASLAREIALDRVGRENSNR